MRQCMKNTWHRVCTNQHLLSILISSENQYKMRMDQLCFPIPFCASESPRKLIKNKIPSPVLEILIKWVWGRAWECVF